MKLIIKKIIFSFLIIFIISSSVILLIPITSDFIIYSNKIFKKIDREIKGKKSNPSENINFRNYKWSKKHFKEYIQLDVEYSDYLIWRRSSFRGETINISEDGFRLNDSSSLNVDFVNSEVWFFGGSAIWGSGSKNEFTIPSFYEVLSNKKSINFGETGYTSSQELNMLLKYINLGKPKYIFFYDGANDIYNKCRKENNYFSSSLEKKIKKYEYKFFKNWYHFETLDLIKNNKDYIINFINYFTEGNEFFDCHKNKKKSKLIVKNLIDNWLIAKHLANNKGAKFVAILQPLSFYTRSKVDHIKVDTEIKKQFDSLYPMITKEVKKYDIKFYDFTNVLDNDDYYFWDFIHLSPNGNKIIAEKIFNLTELN